MRSRTFYNNLPEPRVPILFTRRLDELESFHSRETEPRSWSYLQSKKAALFKISRLKLRSTEIYNCSFGSAIRGISEPLNSFQLILPLEGQIVTRHSNQNLEVQPGFAAIQCPGHCADNCWDDQSQALVVRIGTTSLEPLISRRCLETMRSGRCLVSTNQGLGQSFYYLLNQIFSEYDDATEMANMKDISARNSLEDLMLYCLALTLENQFMDRPNTPEEMKLLPSSLRLILDYIYANLDQPMTLTDLTEVTGVSSRSLQKSFAKHIGKGPLAFIRAAKLTKVREQLLKASPNDTSVTHIAMRWGFYHLGDFSRYYLVQFGEHPSETLNK